MAAANARRGVSGNGLGPGKARRQVAALGALRPGAKAAAPRPPAQLEQEGHGQQGQEQGPGAPSPPADRLGRAAWHALRREGNTPAEAAVRGRVATWAKSKVARRPGPSAPASSPKPTGPGQRSEYEPNKATVRALRNAGWAIFTNKARSLDVPGGPGQLPSAAARGTTAGQGRA